MSQFLVRSVALLLSMLIWPTLRFCVNRLWKAPMPSAKGIDLDSEQASQRFRRLDGRANMVFLGLTVASCVVVYAVLRLVETGRGALLPPGIVDFPMFSSYWTVVAMVMGAAFAMLAYTALSKRWWPDDAAWYAVYLSNRRYRCNYESLLTGMAVAFLFVGSAAALIGWNRYAQIRNDGIAIHYAFAISETHHAWTDVASIQMASAFVAPNGNTRYQTNYVVRFRDGTFWSLRDWITHDQSQDELAGIVAQRAHVQISEVDSFRRGEW